MKFRIQTLEAAGVVLIGHFLQVANRLISLVGGLSEKHTQTVGKTSGPFGLEKLKLVGLLESSRLYKTNLGHAFIEIVILIVKLQHFTSEAEETSMPLESDSTRGLIMDWPKFS
jgi:hypothetical protein